MKKITVFTPTYNRAYCLGQVYDSLCRQSNQAFKWLLVDDGSSDNTKELFDAWALEGKIEMQYLYKTNGGLHTGYNVAIENTHTELFICIDSDDYMPDNAVELILAHWEAYGNSNYAGIMGLDFDLKGNPVGEKLPNVKELHFIDKKNKYNNVGDVKLVHRTELLKKQAPMPTFNKEKNFNPSYIFLKVDTELPLLVLNKNLCFVDYQLDGMSNNILFQFRDSPNSFLELRRLYLTLKNVSLKFKLKNCVHYVSSAIFARKTSFLRDSPMPILTLLSLPFGIILNVYIRIKTSKK